MDNLTLIENAIIERLRTRLPGILVQPYPDSPEVWEPTHPVGALLVRYADGEYGPCKDTAAVVQERELAWEITLAFWSLRGKAAQGGLYAHLEAVRTVLTGFVPPHCLRKLAPVSEEFVTRTTGNLRNKAQRFWQYAITCKTACLNIEVLEDEQPLLLKQVVGIDEQTTQTVEVP